MTMAITSLATRSIFYSETELSDLSSRVHRNAREKGFWEGKMLSDREGNFYLRLIPPDYAEKMVLIATEVAEAFEEYRKPDVNIKDTYEKDGKPEGFPVELADAYIRVLDLIGALVVAQDYSWTKQGPTPVVRHLGPDVGGHCFQILTMIVRCFDLGTETFNPQYLPWILQSIEQACLDLEIDLVTPIAKKISYNATRSYKHGNKRA